MKLGLCNNDDHYLRHMLINFFRCFNNEACIYIVLRLSSRNRTSGNDNNKMCFKVQVL